MVLLRLATFSLSVCNDCKVTGRFLGVEPAARGEARSRLLSEHALGARDSARSDSTGTSGIACKRHRTSLSGRASCTHFTRIMNSEKSTKPERSMSTWSNSLASAVSATWMPNMATASVNSSTPRLPLESASNCSKASRIPRTFPTSKLNNFACLLSCSRCTRNIFSLACCTASSTSSKLSVPDWSASTSSRRLLNPFCCSTLLGKMSKSTRKWTNSSVSKPPVRPWSYKSNSVLTCSLRCSRASRRKRSTTATNSAKPTCR
mmetsp:Transcript_59758/g.182546  ORF Transcript_59758/g.182546 Transcript_59758/m.182546 type:complete len:262 (-) Transcript_59758:1402-2187(-)